MGRKSKKIQEFLLWNVSVLRLGPWKSWGVNMSQSDSALFNAQNVTLKSRLEPSCHRRDGIWTQYRGGGSNYLSLQEGCFDVTSTLVFSPLKSYKHLWDGSPAEILVVTFVFQNLVVNSWAEDFLRPGLLRASSHQPLSLTTFPIKLAANFAEN